MNDNIALLGSMIVKMAKKLLEYMYDIIYMTLGLYAVGPCIVHVHRFKKARGRCKKYVPSHEYFMRISAYEFGFEIRKGYVECS